MCQLFGTHRLPSTDVLVCIGFRLSCEATRPAWQINKHKASCICQVVYTSGPPNSGQLLNHPGGAEAANVEKVVTQLMRGGVRGEQIGVITPYEGQRAHVLSVLSKLGPLGASAYSAIEVSHLITHRLTFPSLRPDVTQC